MNEVLFKTPVPSDLDEINHLIYASKSYWGYSSEYMDKFMQVARLTEAYLQKNLIKMMLSNNKMCGITSFIQRPDGTLELDYFLIHPDYIGQGLGKKLWQHSCECALQLNDTGFIIISDPNAENFYKKMGCVKIGMKKTSFQESEVPVLQYTFGRN